MKSTFAKTHICNKYTQYIHITLPESAKSQLNHGPVEYDHCWDVCVVDGLLQVGHEHQIPGKVPLVVQAVVVYLEQDGPGAKLGCCVVL